MTIYSEKEIDENKHISDVQRYMYFRTDGFVDAGGRFKNIPDRLPYGAENYIKAFEQAVKGAIEGDVSDKEITKRKKAEKAERDKAAAEFVKEEKSAKANEALEEKRDDFVAIISANFSSADADVKAKAKEMLTESGAKKFTDADLPIETLKAISDLFA